MIDKKRNIMTKCQIEWRYDPMQEKERIQVRKLKKKVKIKY